MMKQIPAIKSVNELRNMNLEELKIYKADIIKAKNEAPTYLAQEGYANQLERVNTVLNERQVEDLLEQEDRNFKKLRQEIQQVIDDAEKRGIYFDVPGFKSSLYENKTSQDTNTGTSSKLDVATAEGPNLVEESQ